MDGFEKTSITDIDFSELENVKRMPMVALRGKVILPNVFTSFDVGRIKSLNAVNAAIDNKDSLIFSCSTAVGRAVDKCDIKLQGEEFEIGINSRYILDALKATESDEVKVIFKGSLSAIVIKPTTGDDFLYMMMPMRLK